MPIRINFPCYWLIILKILYSLRFPIFRRYILFVHSVIHLKTLRSFLIGEKVFCKTSQTWINVIYGSSKNVKQQRYSIWCGGRSYCNPFRGPVVLQLVKKSFAKVHKLKQTWFMALTWTSSSSLHIEQCDFEQKILSGPLQLNELSSYYVF